MLREINYAQLSHRNISACKEFAETVQTCYGPNGMNKMVINHLEKLFVTNDAATIIRSVFCGANLQFCHIPVVGNLLSALSQ
jgi:chaperonin GroEL (HSP60 family)